MINNIKKIFANPNIVRLKNDFERVKNAHSVATKSYSKNIAQLKRQIKLLTVSRDTAKTIYTRIDNIINTDSLTDSQKIKLVGDTIIKFGGDL